MKNGKNGVDPKKHRQKDSIHPRLDTRETTDSPTSMAPKKAETTQTSNLAPPPTQKPLAPLSSGNALEGTDKSWSNTRYEPTSQQRSNTTNKVITPPLAATPQSVIHPIPNIPGVSLLCLEFVQDIFERQDDLSKSKAHMALLKDAHKEEVIDDDEIIGMYHALLKGQFNLHPCFPDLEKIAKKIEKHRTYVEKIPKKNNAE